MTEHYCTEHGVTYFKKGKMKGYAHPIEGGGDWCNMPEAPETERETAIKEEIHNASKPTSDDMSKKDWADKDRITRESIETQTAYNGIIALASSSDTGLARAHDTGCLRVALDWAMAHFTTVTDAQTNETAEKVDDVREVSDPPVFKNQTEFYNACFETYGLKRAQVDKEITYPLKTKADVKKAWDQIVATYEVFE